MADYNSKEVSLHGSATAVFSTLSHPESLRNFLKDAPLDQIPEDKRSILESFDISGDTITIKAGPAGAMTLKVNEVHEPDYVKYEGIGLPVQMFLIFRIQPVDTAVCRATVTIDAAIPMMLKPMIGPTLQKAADQFAQMLSSIPQWS